MKVMTLLGTRPELIKLSETIKLLDKHVDHTFVHTGQNYDYELDEIFYDDLDLRKPDHNLKARTVPEILSAVEIQLKATKPDAVVILGDTNSALSAYVAKRMKIPIFHLEAGNRCFDDNTPEEINRRIVDHIADINLVYTEHARRNLIAEGIKPDRIFLTGSPMMEVINNHIELRSTEESYYLVSMHREENIDNADNLKALIMGINGLASCGKVILSCHPRLAKKNIKWHKNVEVHKPFKFTDYIRLQRGAICVVSDSGTLAEESAILRVRAVSIRNTTERPEAIDSGSMTLCSDFRNIGKAVSISSIVGLPLDYRNSNFSECVLKIILGYTGYINKYVWGKNGQ